MPALDNPGGVTIYSQTVASALRARGHHVTVFAVGQSQRVATEPDLYCINAVTRAARRRQLFDCLSTLETSRPFDLLIANNLQTAAFLRHHECRACKVFTLHQPSLLAPTGRLTHWRRQHRLKRLFHRQHLTAVSKAYLDNFLLHYPMIRPSSTQVTYNPIEQTNLLRRSGSAQSGESGYLLSVGRLTRTKNHAALLQAYARLPSDTPELIIMGDGPEKPVLQALTQTLGLAHRVKWLGWQANPYPFIRQARLLVHTARAESFGRVLAEALALGTPVVAVDCRYGPAEILTGALADFLVSPDDMDALCHTIMRALQHYPALNGDIVASFAAARTAAAYERYLS